MLRKFSMLFVIAMLMFAVTISAGDYKKGDKATKAEAKHATFEGKLVCLGCDLKHSEDARAACTDFGHKHALKTTDGKYINFLENKYSKDLVKGEKLHNKDLQIHGVYFASANTLDVESFKAKDGKKQSWCDHCTSMDACSAK